jgi:hypothetical protein
MAKYRLLKSRLTGQRAILNILTKELTKEAENPSLYRELRAKAILNNKQRAKTEALQSLGLTRVKGQNGGIYWE